MAFDVAVVGLGTAGAAAAFLCARAGLRVVAFDRAALDQAGATWFNGVPGGAFDDSGIPRPQGAELAGSNVPMHLVAGWGPERVVLRDHGLLEVDMAGLVARLQAGAADAGAQLRGESRVSSIEPGAVTVGGERIEARWVVDASGMTGLRGRRAAPGDICVAAQHVHHVADDLAARSWFAQHAVPVGETLCFSGVAGGYSIVNVCLHGDRVAILTGSIPGEGHRAGGRLMDEFVDAHDWIGPLIRGGRRAIPLHRAHGNLGEGGIARIGDAAGQVYGPHGSGIAQQLVAARILTSALVDGGGIAGYNVAWQRQQGGLIAGADLFRRFSQTLSTEQLRQLIRREILAPSLLLGGLQQAPPSPDPREALRAARRLARMPGMAARLVPVLARIPLIEAHYARYPDDPARLPGWQGRLRWLSGVA